MNKNINIAERAIEQVIVDFLIDNYGTIADVRCGCYGDVNHFYSPYGSFSIIIKPHAYPIESCTTSFIEQKLKEIIEPVKIAYEYYLKLLETLPKHVELSVPLKALKDNDSDKKLSIYFEGCNLLDDKIIIYIGIMII